MHKKIVFYSVQSKSGMRYRGFFFAQDRKYLQRMFAYRSLKIRWAVFLPYWLSIIIINIFKYTPLLRVSTKHIQGVFAQIHNSLLVGKHIHEQLINLIFNNNHFSLRYELINIHQDILDGKNLSIALSGLLSQQYSVLAALLVEAEKGDAFEDAIHETSNAITRLSQQKSNLFNLLIPFLVFLTVSIYFAHLLSSLYITPRLALISLVGGDAPWFIRIYNSIFASESTLETLLEIAFICFFVIVAYSTFRSSRYYPKLFYKAELMLPVVGNIQKSLCSLLLIRALAIGFKSNLRMVNIIHQAAIHTKHKVLKNRLLTSISFIKKGELPISAVTRSRLLPFQYRYLFNQLLREADSTTGINNILRLGESELKRFYVLVKEGTRSVLFIILISMNMTTLYAYIGASIAYSKYTV
ncbi:MAG TPA: hypothetical protein QF353_06670 [Gammaproteobacteria bacterium]|nr:hypothetical protein [Gammaproteobacteria bacterium]